MKNIFTALILFFVACSCSNAQSPCKDPNKIDNPYYPCYTPYLPVCACDGNTYRSACSAENQYSINATTGQNWVDGPCGNFDFNIDPTFVNYSVSYFLKLKIYLKLSGNINISVYDVYGHLFYQEQIFQKASDSFTGAVGHDVDVSTFNQGVYIIVLNLGGEQQVKKFYKSNN